MNALGFDVSTDPKAIRYGGETYADGDKVEVIFEVNGEAVGPEYVLKGGDEIRVVVREA
jgi:molybdopterin converting factor small subunit